MTSSTQYKKTIFDLPQELRDMIYELTFTRTVDLNLSLPKPNHSNGSLVLTSSQIHAETARLYYARTHFYATKVDKLFDWVTALPPKYVNAIRTIRCSWRVEWVLEKLWDYPEHRQLALMLSDKMVLKEWRDGQWVAPLAWRPANAVFGTTQARMRAIP